MLPVRCFVCRKVLRGDRDRVTRQLVAHNFDEVAALASLGYTRVCCRNTITQTIDRNEIRDMFDNANMAKPPHFPPAQNVRQAPRTTEEVHVQAV